MPKVNSVRKSVRDARKRHTTRLQPVTVRPAEVWEPNVKGTRFKHGKRIKR